MTTLPAKIWDVPKIVSRDKIASLNTVIKQTQKEKSTQDIAYCRLNTKTWNKNI